MESRTWTYLVAIFLFLSSSAVTFADFESAPITKVDPNFFTYTGARSLLGAPPPAQLRILHANRETFPALGQQAVSSAVMQFPGGALYPPHSHPRSSELLLLISGTFQVGFIDAQNQLFNQTLHAGDMFLFPTGLLHYHFNSQQNDTAVVISSFGSADPGVLSIPSNLFTAGVDDEILALSFNTDIPTIQRLKAGLVQN